jgi:hypothetical protein|tara:strand:+ start:32 stop:373 length:342 start_codon:yes stop_codon:yes gene_type:complete
MKIGDLYRRVQELGVEEGDPIRLSTHQDGSIDAVFGEIRFTDGGHPRFQHSAFEYVLLGGLTQRYFGNGENKNFDFDMRYSGMDRWEPESNEDREKVEKIRADLEKGTFEYIV